MTTPTPGEPSGTPQPSDSVGATEELPAGGPAPADAPAASEPAAAAGAASPGVSGPGAPGPAGAYPTGPYQGFGPHGPGQHLPPGYPPPYPFAPTVREPWINPAKRRGAALVGAATGVVLLAAGFLIGAASFGGRDGGDRMGPGNRPGYLMPAGPRMGDGYGRGRMGRLPDLRPGGPQAPTPSSVPTASSAPSSTHS
jgi:hypothetical protein